MSLNNENILTIGSVVKLKGTNNLAMIVGYGQIVNEKIYDYIGVLYPQGVIDNKGFLHFNNDDIYNIEHYGFSNKKDVIYKESLVNILNAINKK